MLHVTELTKTFTSGDGTVVAVNNVNLSIAQGELASIVGRSGSGKTTLMSMLGALERPTSGKIEVDGRDITRMHDKHLMKYRGQKLGFVFQSYNLIPNLTALENVLLGLEFAGFPKNKRKIRARQVLDQVGITLDKQTRRPGRLSGGEQQRVAIARALAHRPKLILADEPTGNLDTQTSAMIVRLLQELSRTEQTTIIVVTHDQALAAKTDRTFRLQDGVLQQERNTI